MKSSTPELINSLTPIFIAMIGGIIGVTVLVTSSDKDSAKWASGMGLAGTAIAGAAGLAQSSKSESTVSERNSETTNQNKEGSKQTS